MIRYHYIIIQDDGIFKQGMVCYCFAETETHLFLFFRRAIIGDIHEVKLPKSKVFLLKRL